MTTIITATPANVVVEANHVAADANAVVLHDISAVAPAAARSNISAYSQLQSLVADKSVWETNAYRSSNDQLYALLQRCYRLYKDMCADRATAKQLVADVDQYLADNGARVNSSTHTISKIVKAVFGADRRRVSAYSIALRAALAANISAENLPEYSCRFNTTSTARSRRGNSAAFFVVGSLKRGVGRVDTTFLCSEKDA